MRNSAVWHNDDSFLKDDGLHNSHQDSSWVGVLYDQFLLVGTEVGQLRGVLGGGTGEWLAGRQGDNLLTGWVGGQ